MTRFLIGERGPQYRADKKGFRCRIGFHSEEFARTLLGASLVRCRRCGSTGIATMDDSGGCVVWDDKHPAYVADEVRRATPAHRADMQSAAHAGLAEQARQMALGYAMQAVSVLLEAPTPDADVLAALDVVVDLLSGKG